MEIIEPAKSYRGIYAMHKYWGKKPFNVISEFIKKYSEAGDTVLDSFCGSGITLIEAVKLNRKAVGIDLNPMAVKLARASMTKIDIELLKEEFRKIKEELKPLINAMYETKCGKCGNIAYETHIIWEKALPVEVWYQCDHCKINKTIREGNMADKLQAENPIIKPLWFPDTEMFENSRINVKSRQRISDLFTNRALSGLSYIFDRIKKVENPAIKEALEITFTGAVSQASNLVFVIRRRNKNIGIKNKNRGRAEVGSWVVGYWVPEEHFEINVWNCFENRFKKILNGKKEINKMFEKDICFCRSFEELKHSENGVMISKGSAVSIDIPDDSIDYVFIDPPHGNRILYMEMSLLWNAWLGLDKECDWEKEIIVSEAKDRNKDVHNYTEMMNLSLLEIKRVLKPDKYFSLAFNSLDDETWFALLNMCVKSGFHVVDIYPLEYSATSVVQDNRQNALKTDFVITCRKGCETQGSSIEMNMDINQLIHDIKTILEHNSLQTYDVMNKLFQSSIYRGYIYPPTKILAMLEKEFIYIEGKWRIR